MTELHFIARDAKDKTLVFITDEKRPMVSYLPIWRGYRGVLKFVERYNGQMTWDLFSIEEYLASVEWHRTSGIEVYIKPMDF